MHIPLHIMSCSACPPEIKRALKEKKEDHATLKQSLPKGSQKQFFSFVFNRLHSSALPVLDSNNALTPPV